MACAVWTTHFCMTIEFMNLIKHDVKNNSRAAQVLRLMISNVSYVVKVAIRDINAKKICDRNY